MLRCEHVAAAVWRHCEVGLRQRSIDHAGTRLPCHAWSAARASNTTAFRRPVQLFVCAHLMLDATCKHACKISGQLVDLAGHHQTGACLQGILRSMYSHYRIEHGKGNVLALSFSLHTRLH